MPFLQFASIHIAVSHLSSLIAESSKIVFTLTEYCLPQFRHWNRFWTLSQCWRWDAEAQMGHTGPSGQRIEATVSMQTCSSVKYLIASERLLSWFVMAKTE